MTVHIQRLATTRRRRLLAVALAYGAVAVLSASSAEAATIASNAYRYGDCTLTTALDRPYANGADVRAAANVSCTSRHAWTVGRSYVQYYTATGWVTDYSSSRSTTFYNSYGMGDRWLWTANSRTGCSWVRSLTTASIAGLGDAWVASAGKYVCASA